MVYQGRNEEEVLTGLESAAIFDTFSVAPLKCDLFDPNNTPLLESIPIRNSVWQKIIRGMSLASRKKFLPPGRDSYAQLGVNHLGAIYEALLSYRGFIASTDLYGVKQKGKNPDKLAPAYFVNAEALKKTTTKMSGFMNRKGDLSAFPRAGSSTA